MHPSSIISFYPTYAILDEVVSYSNYDTLNIYIDLKNVMQSLYMQHAIINIVENSLKAKNVDTSIFASIVAFLAFHKLYAIKKQNLKLNYYVFFESGQSYYHLNVDKKYKINRRIDDLYGLEKDKRDYFFEIMQRNFKLIEGSLNRIPDIKVIRLQNLEADFVPYYLITRNLVNKDSNVAHLIYSNDHDLFQCVADNVFVFSKSQKGKKIIKKGESLKEYLKFKKNLPDDYLPLVMSIIGDMGDYVRGIDGIGGKRIEECIEEVVKMGGGIESIYSNVMNGKPLFDTTMCSNPNKYINKIVENSDIVSKNLKLVSFEVLSRYLDNPITTEMLDKRNYILDILKNKSIVPLEPMKAALDKVGVYLQEDSLETLYFSKE